MLKGYRTYISLAIGMILTIVKGVLKAKGKDVPLPDASVVTELVLNFGDAAIAICIAFAAVFRGLASSKA